jgi:hypothetical protein
VKRPAPGMAQGSAPGLKLLHGIVFTGFTAVCCVVGAAEFEQLLDAQRHTFHAGPPPRPQVLLAVLASLVSLGVILVQAVRGRSARLRWSVLVLVALALELWDFREGPVPGRTASAANLRLLQKARALHGVMVNRIQKEGRVPEDEGTWRQALEELTHAEPSLVRTRSFQPLPYRLQKVASPDTVPPGTPPGTLLLYVQQGGLAYELEAVGISPEGEPWRLQQLPTTEPVVLRAAYNPELPAAPGTELPARP